VNFIGIDPSQRHTGLCLLAEAGPDFFEIKPTQDTLLESLEYLADEFASWLCQNWRTGDLICMERQLSVGGQSSSLMFTVQMLMLSCIKRHAPLQEMRLVMPMPIQLKSYLIRVHGIDTKNKSSIVAGFKEQTGWQGRISSHRVEAYYLALLAKDVSLGSWRYNIPTKEVKLFAGTIINGDAS